MKKSLYKKMGVAKKTAKPGDLMKASQKIKAAKAKMKKK
jgi:hypothetical protein